MLADKVYRLFAPRAVRPMDVSPYVWTIRPMHVSPHTRHFAALTLRPYRRFTPLTWGETSMGRFASPPWGETSMGELPIRRNV